MSQHRGALAGEIIHPCSQNGNHVEEYNRHNDLKLRKYEDMHTHCASCIRPSRCINRLPAPFQSDGDPPLMSDEELYSLVLSVDYHHNQSKGSDYNEEICPVIRCPQPGCEVITHYCKLEEHLHLCGYRRVWCVNVSYGCPYSLLRKDMSCHLQHCPANVVHCSFEWNRWPLHTTEKSKGARIHCPPQALDVNDLDVALVLRDQRMLKQLWQANRPIKRAMKTCLSHNPAVPIKPYIGIRTYREYTRKRLLPSLAEKDDGQNGEKTASEQAQAVPLVVIHYDDIDEELYVEYATRLCNSSYQEALAEIINRNAQVYKREAAKRYDNRQTARKKSNSICQMTVDKENPKLVNGHCQEETTSVSVMGVVPIEAPPAVLDFSAMVASTSHPSSSSINLPIRMNSLTLRTDTPDSSETTKQAAPPPPPGAETKCNSFSLDICIRTLPSYQPKPRAMYTFRCGHDFRVDELESHYRDVHAHIHGGLDGWIEHRCPLFQYGCSFVHRRWAPHSQEEVWMDHKKTLVYNELLETFAWPMVDTKVTIKSSGSSPSSSTSLDPDSIECCSSGSCCSSSGSPSKKSTSTLSLLSNCSLSLSSVEAQGENARQLNLLPVEVLENICQYLDGFSLNSLSFTSKRFRHIVQAFLKRRGYVSLQWKRFDTDQGGHTWQAVYKKWQFSNAMEPIRGWTMDAENVIATHLQRCAFNDRVVHTQPFILIDPNQVEGKDALQYKKDL